MKDAISTHLAVALLAHWDMPQHHVPRGLLPTYGAYADNKRMFPHLLKTTTLKDFLLSDEILIPNTIIGRATLVALALICNELPIQRDPSQIENFSKNDMLYNRMRTRLRLRRL